jgi:glucokinase
VPAVILAGDVGGTKTRLALFSSDGSPRQPVREHRAASRDFPSLEALVLGFLEETGTRVDAAVIGIAGPVVDNRCETTNLPWTMDGAVLGERLGGARVRLINDLEATGWGLSLLGEGEVEVLQRGTPLPGNRALIAAGTGLGEGLMVWDGTSHRPTPSEGGHCDFGPRDPLEDELNVWLRAKHGRVSYERILSGRGLADLYQFMGATGRGHESRAVADRIAGEADPARVVTATALDGTCERAQLALERWVSIYGAEAGNLALKALAVNGLFVGGGIAPRVAPVLRGGGFIESFRRKGRLSSVLERIPVTLVLDDRAALWGAAARALAVQADATAP